MVMNLYLSLPLSLIFRITQIEEYIAHLYQMSQNWVIDLSNKVINELSGDSLLLLMYHFHTFL